MGSGGIPSKVESESLRSSTIILPNITKSGCLSIVVLGASGDLAKKEYVSSSVQPVSSRSFATRGCLHFGICSNKTFEGLRDRI